MDTMMTPDEFRNANLERLRDHAAIGRLVALFDEATNRRDADLFAELWTESAIWEIGEPRPMRVEGAAKVRERWQEMLGATVWLFRGSFAGVVEVRGDTAVGRWPCIESGALREAGKYDNYAEYEDEYRRTGTGWRFARRRYRYLRLSTDIVPGAGADGSSARRDV